MISQAQALVSKSMGKAVSPFATIKSLAASHPVALGVVIGVGAYYVVNEYLLTPDENELEDSSENTKEADQTAVAN